MSGMRGVSIVAFVCLIVANTQVWSAAGWTAYGAVIELTPTTAGRFLVELAVDSNPSGCRDKQVFYRDYTGTGADNMFQTILTAVSFGKRIRVYVTGNCDINGYSEITSASITP